MAMFKNLKSFTYSSIENFPKDVCTIPDKNENGIFVSNKKYLVLYIDIRFPVEKYITYATPYVWMDNGNQTFGWSGLDGGLLLGNVENSCQYYNEYVVGFVPTPVDNEYTEQDEKTFNEFKKRIEEYLKKWSEEY